MSALVVAAFVVALAAVVVLGLLALSRFRWTAASRPTRLPTRLVERRAVVVLDVEHGDPTALAVQRLVQETAARVFAAMPDCEEVEVRARDGSVLARHARSTREPRTISLPEFLHEPHSPRHRGPDPTEHLSQDVPFLPPIREGPVQLATPAPPATRQGRPPATITERLDLVPAIRTAVRHPDDPVDVIRAILETGGLPVEVDGDLLIADGLAIAVVRHIESGVHEPLNHAYLRIAASGAERGLVVALQHVDGEEIRRRELLAPEVLHTGFAGVQRMADAVALGADPIRFAIAPAVVPAGAAIR